MLILLQDGKSAFTLTEPFQIEVREIYENPKDIFELYREHPPKIINWEVVLEQDDNLELLGEFASLSEAKNVVDSFTSAYEHDLRVFRVK